MKGCWVIKVKYLDFNNDVNFNEAYWKEEDCKKAILKKIKPEFIEYKTDFKIKDLEHNILYEMKYVEVK